MVKHLNNLYLFKGLPDDKLALIDEISELDNFARGDVIFRQGDIADSFYVIQYGTVSIEVDDEDEDGEQVTVATLGTGSHFGEMAFLDNEPRSASAIAGGNSNIIRISYGAMTELLAENADMSIHVYRALSKFLCSRLRLTTLDLSYERQKNLGHL